MDGLTLLQDAEAAGLSVDVKGDRLVIRGPPRLSSIAALLIDNKAAVLEALALRSEATLGAVESCEGHTVDELLAAVCDLCGSAGPVLMKMVGSRGAYWMCGACRLKLRGGA